jgi:hypothetical protein
MTSGGYSYGKTRPEEGAVKRAKRKIMALAAFLMRPRKKTRQAYPQTIDLPSAPASAALRFE